MSRWSRYVPLPTVQSDGFTRAEAEAVMRRAVEIHERQAQSLSVDELRAQLAALGLSSEAIERATREVLQAPAIPKAPWKPSDVLMPVLMLLVFGTPGAVLVAYRHEIPFLPWWISAPVGALLLFVVLLTVWESLAEWWRGGPRNPIGIRPG